MKAKIVAKNIGIAPARFGMRIFYVTDKGGADPVTTLELPRLIEPGETFGCEFDWPFEGRHPGDFRYKSLIDQVGLWQMVSFEVGPIQVLEKSGLLV